MPSLSGSEFFGHEKGAFTGAAAARDGAFELADGGTLFLDEVGELPVTLQAELLRVIQEGTFKRVGSNTWRKSSFRLVCATNRDLAAEQAHGARFRSDFFYRIAGCTLHLPSLRDRTEDILPLFRHFFRQAHPDREPPELYGPVRDLLAPPRRTRATCGTCAAWHCGSSTGTSAPASSPSATCPSRSARRTQRRRSRIPGSPTTSTPGWRKETRSTTSRPPCRRRW